MFTFQSLSTWGRIELIFLTCSRAFKWWWLGSIYFSNKQLLIDFGVWQTIQEGTVNTSERGFLRKEKCFVCRKHLLLKKCKKMWQTTCWKGKLLNPIQIFVDFVVGMHAKITLKYLRLPTRSHHKILCNFQKSINTDRYLLIIDQTG